jgi:hypothetical protein
VQGTEERLPDNIIMRLPRKMLVDALLSGVTILL